MSQASNVDRRSSWAKLQGDFELRNTAEFAAPPGGKPAIVDLSPPALPSPTRNRKILLVIGLILAVFDVFILPIVFFYSLTYATNLTPRYVFIVITCLFCMMTFAHYTHRCLRLMLKCSVRYGPIGWRRKWRLLEFTNVNFAICASTFETLLLIGTFPEKPIVRLCAMPSATMCYYLGTLFLVTAFLTQKGYHLPFPMSSTPKGALWRPALLAILEDSGAIEARGELAHREAVMKRYEASPPFRRMLVRLTWFWGISLMIIAIVTTVLIVSLEERVAFGVGWGLPYVWSGLFGLWTVRFVKKSLKEERAAWQTGTYSGVRI
ncbi:hypothetical protein L207DRAFT_498560 [Hyaloscypha variabilis F]|uniref:Uncharacterized protein n=1 Tax=Hyaloscypha variabilis (strain UAMH 11265 / GT02V1 / F) TaxID=1149755 RepID=A0A2J6R652_HYAVF|nr:hypothetical protein L207DRAFT_498560 [Hyaloscypha variabilis F]